MCDSFSDPASVVWLCSRFQDFPHGRYVVVNLFSFWNVPQSFPSLQTFQFSKLCFIYFKIYKTNVFKNFSIFIYLSSIPSQIFLTLFQYKIALHLWKWYKPRLDKCKLEFGVNVGQSFRSFEVSIILSDELSLNLQEFFNKVKSNIFLKKFIYCFHFTIMHFSLQTASIAG